MHELIESYYQFLTMSFVGDSFQLKVFFILIIAILFLVVLAFLFSLFTVYLRYKNDKKREIYTLLEKKWEPKIFDYLGNDLTKEDVFNTVNQSEEVFFVDYLYRFEQRLDGRSKEMIKVLAKPYLKYIEKNMTSPSPEIRAKALMILGNLDEGDYLYEIIEMLDDKSPVVSIIAAKTLSQLGNIEALDDVVMHMHRYEFWSRDLLARNLSFFGVEACEFLIFVFLTEDFDDQTRIIAADTLVILNNYEIHPVAFKTLKSSESNEIKAACLRLLSNTHEAEYIEYIRELTISDNFLIKLYALKLLSAAGNLSDHKVFIRLLRDEEPWIRIYAARALKSTRGYDVLVELSKEKGIGYDAVVQVLNED